MRNPLKTPASNSLGLLLVRLPVGIIFINAAVMKFRMGVGTFVSSSIGLAPPYLPEQAARAYLYTLPVVEMIVGLLILFGWFTRVAALIASLILISIIMAVSGFHESLVPNQNAILLSITLMLLLAGPGGFALDNYRFKRGGKSKLPE